MTVKRRAVGQVRVGPAERSRRDRSRRPARRGRARSAEAVGQHDAGGDGAHVDHPVTGQQGDRAVVVHEPVQHPVDHEHGQGVGGGPAQAGEDAGVEVVGGNGVAAGEDGERRVLDLGRGGQRERLQGGLVGVDVETGIGSPPASAAWAAWLRAMASSAMTWLRSMPRARRRCAVAHTAGGSSLMICSATMARMADRASLSGSSPSRATRLGTLVGIVEIDVVGDPVEQELRLGRIHARHGRQREERQGLTVRRGWDGAGTGCRHDATVRGGSGPAAATDRR